MSRPDYPPTPTQAEHEHEQRLELMRRHWQEDRGRIQSELEYARRSVAALEAMLYGYEAAIAATQPVNSTLDGRNSDKYQVSAMGVLSNGPSRFA